MKKPLTGRALDAAIDRVRQKLLADIEHFGRSVVCCFPTADSKDVTNESYQYTVGNWRRRLPELLIVGLYNDEYTLNRLSEIMLERAKPFEEGEVVDLGGKCPVCVVQMSEAGKVRYMNAAKSYWGGADKFDAMQVVLPDREGKFPWNRGCAEPYSKVVVHRAKPLN